MLEVCHALQQSSTTQQGLCNEGLVQLSFHKGTGCRTQDVLDSIKQAPLSATVVNVARSDNSLATLVWAPLMCCGRSESFPTPRGLEMEMGRKSQEASV